jgi:23S rRNA pseudouridine1911/1915/1917 synthase
VDESFTRSKLPPTIHPVGRTDQGKRLDQFLKEKIPSLSRTRIQQIIRQRVSLSWGADARPSSTVHAGGEVHIFYRELNETPLEIEIPIVARGPGWICIDKPPKIPVHPVAKAFENTVIRMLRRQEGDDELRLTHRLDAETTGALIVAEDNPTARHLSRSFFHDKVKKEYVALVHGRVTEDEGEIDLPIGQPPNSRVWVRLAAGEEYDKPSLTRWRVERRYAETTLLRLFPKSGRRHQLRVHLESIGHPIVADPLYGHPDSHYLAMVEGNDPRRERPGPQRMLLHCAKMSFPDPVGDGLCEVEAPLPEDFTCHLKD